ncbi:heparinase II/III domain-containing protein [Geomonas sp. Red276]
MATRSHPRLLITANDATRLATLAATPRYRAIEAMALGRIKGGMLNVNLKSQAMVAAYVAMSERAAGRSDAPYVATALRIAKEQLVPAHFDPGNGWDAMVARANIVTGLSFVYDWCYNAMTEEDRRIIRNALVADLRKMKRNYDGVAVPPAKTPWAVHDEYHNMFFLDKGTFILGMAALGLDDPGLPGVQELLEAAKDFERRVVRGINTAQKNGGGWQEGWHYFFDGQGVLHWMPVELASWSSATSEPVFQEAQALAGMALNIIYARKPNLLLDRVDEAAGGDEIKKGSRAPLLILAKVYGNGYFKYLANLTPGFPQPTSYPQAALSLIEMFYDDDSVAAKSAAEVAALPPTFFAEGQGTAYIRSGVGGGGDLFSSFRAKPLYNMHQNPENNSFNIYYKGELTGKSGYYMGWDAPHTMKYLRKSISANTVLVDYPRQEKGWGTSEGGQLIPGYNLTGRPPLPYAHTVFEEERDYAVAIGDASRAYATDQLSRFVRTFLYLKDLKTFVVHDRVDAREPSFAKRWLLHTVGEPELYRGSEKISAGMEPGIAEFPAADSITVVNGGGRLVLTPLFPEAVSIRKIGGAGYQFWIDREVPANYDDKELLEPDGALKPPYQVAGSWRIELIPTVPAQTDLFLNVLDISDAEGGNPASFRRVVAIGNKGRGVEVVKDNATRVVLFGDEPATLRLSYALPGPDREAVHIIGNLAPRRKFDVKVKDGLFTISRSPAGRWSSSAQGFLVYRHQPPH